MDDGMICAWWNPGYRWFCLRLWYRELPNRLAWWVASRVPRRVALYAFVRVYAAATGDAPHAEYSRVYQAWEQGEARR